MVKLLILSDDFTGALDTGIQFATRGAVTRVVTEPLPDYSLTDAEVLVLVTETRHLPAQEAYDIVYRAARAARNSGIRYIYKKTDSALRGNIGSELAAVMDAADADSIAFLPAFPKMSRTTRNGIHYISGVPVAESVFGQDPFEPVQSSSVPALIRRQTSIPVIQHRVGEPTDTAKRPGIQLYDAETDTDLVQIGAKLGAAGLHLSAGCAGFASILADILEINGPQPQMPQVPASLFVVCGSVNPVTLRQMQQAEQEGFLHIHLNPPEKLEPGWLGSEDCARKVHLWLKQAQEKQRCILDVNDPPGQESTVAYAEARALTPDDLRIRIAAQLSQLVKRLLDGGLNATILCTGGDTLLALMRTLGITELTPVQELTIGTVLTCFNYQGTLYYIISKSGGFGAPDLLCKLAALLEAGNSKETAIC